MYSAFCAVHDRWPRWVSRIGLLALRRASIRDDGAEFNPGPDPFAVAAFVLLAGETDQPAEGRSESESRGRFRLSHLVEIQQRVSLTLKCKLTRALSARRRRNASTHSAPRARIQT